MLGLSDAFHAEYRPEDSDSDDAIINLAACPVPPPSGPRLDGRMHVAIEHGSRAASIYGGLEAYEQLHCSYGLRDDAHHLFDSGALRIVGWGDTGEARIVEISAAPFCIATLYLPQLAPLEDGPHPLIAAFLQAVAAGR